ncbi:MAG TPA: nuclear transport factor 2 family protein [Longimicrobium sp.]|nr:nuclear transport factor 2 family protein [Longimicrobium sp.]
MPRRPLLLLFAVLCSAIARPAAAQTADEERVVQAQVDAFNRHDVEGFMAAFTPDVIFWEYPADTVFAGAARVRQHYTELFGDPDAKGLHAEVRQRIVKGRFVIDHELVTGLPGEGSHVSVVIYEVAGGRIRNAWFMN